LLLILIPGYQIEDQHDLGFRTGRNRDTLPYGRKITTPTRNIGIKFEFVRAFAESFHRKSASRVNLGPLSEKAYRPSSSVALCRSIEEVGL
jgi:hypothetical protein